MTSLTPLLSSEGAPSETACSIVEMSRPAYSSSMAMKPILLVISWPQKGNGTSECLAALAALDSVLRLSDRISHGEDSVRLVSDWLSSRPVPRSRDNRRFSEASSTFRRAAQVWRHTYCMVVQPRNIPSVASQKCGSRAFAALLHDREIACLPASHVSVPPSLAALQARQALCQGTRPTV